MIFSNIDNRMVNVREYCAGLVRLESLHERLEGLRIHVEETEMEDDKRKELNRYGNTIYLEYMVLKAELVRQKVDTTEEEKREVQECTFTEEEVAYITTMKPVFAELAA